MIARETFLHNIQDLAERNRMAIVYVTHHTEEILPFFNKAALMKDGELVEKGELEEVFSQEILEKFFGVKTSILWTDQHFFINLDLQIKHQGIQSFKKEAYHGSAKNS